MGLMNREFKGQSRKVIKCKKVMLIKVLQKYDSNSQYLFVSFSGLKSDDRPVFLMRRRPNQFKYFPDSGSLMVCKGMSLLSISNCSFAFRLNLNLE